MSRHHRTRHHRPRYHARYDYTGGGGREVSFGVMGTVLTIASLVLFFLLMNMWPTIGHSFVEGWRYGEFGTLLLMTFVVVVLAGPAVVCGLYMLLALGQALLDGLPLQPGVRAALPNDPVEDAERALAFGQGWATVSLALLLAALAGALIDATVQARQHGWSLGPLSSSLLSAPLSHSLWIALALAAISQWFSCRRADHLTGQVHRMRAQRVQARADWERQQQRLYLEQVAEAHRQAAEAAAREAVVRAAEAAARAAALAAQTAALAASQAREEEVRVAREERDRLHHAADRLRAEALRGRLSGMPTLPPSPSPIPLYQGEVCHCVVPAWSLANHARTDGLTPLDRGELAPAHHLVLTSHRVVFLDSAEQHISDLTRVERLCVEGAYCLAVKVRVRPLYDVFQLDGPAEFASYLACAAERAGQTPEVIYSAGVADGSQRG